MERKGPKPDCAKGEAEMCHSLREGFRQPRGSSELRGPFGISSSWGVWLGFYTIMLITH